MAQTGYDYDVIGAVDCPAKDDIKSITAAQLQMRFYIDDNFSTPFFKDNDGVMDLGSNQVQLLYFIRQPGSVTFTLKD